WLKQFQGYDGTRPLTVGKSIDAISGATVSVFSITDDIQEKTRLLKKIVSK
ncbi:MAG TPA: FMN-binding protein, partial [Prolixibacteraceae bacterium]|nr:FMN-binding protein [Prolixibacteraceae bacterium]